MRLLGCGVVVSGFGCIVGGGSVGVGGGLEVGGCGSAVRSAVEVSGCGGGRLGLRFVDDLEGAGCGGLAILRWEGGNPGPPVVFQPS